jgi:Flp pilus assembly protein TadG
MRTRGREKRPVLRAFAGARSGVAAIEFALIAPLMLALLVGGSEIARATMNVRRVSVLTRTLADLTSLGDTVSPMASGTMGDIFTASKLVLTPFSASGVAMRVSAIGVYVVGNTRTIRVCSSSGSNIVARPVGVAGADLVIPSVYNRNGMRLVVAEVSMTYAPMLGTSYAQLFGAATSSFPITRTVVWPTRQGTPYTSGADDEVVLPSGSACPKT